MVVSSNQSVGPEPRTKISFFLLSACTDKPLSKPKLGTCFPNSPPGNENCEHVSNPIPLICIANQLIRSNGLSYIPILNYESIQLEKNKVSKNQKKVSQYYRFRNHK